MVWRSIIQRVSATSKQTTSPVAAKGRRSSATFPDLVKARHGKQLEELDKNLEEALKSRNHSSNGVLRGILDQVTDRIISRGCRLVQVGSSVNGLYSDNSDLDLVFFPTNTERRRKFFKDFHGNGDFKMQFMYTLSRLLTREIEKLGVDVESSIVLHQLRIPLLIVHLKSGQSMDIQFPNEEFQAIRNTNLIRHYVQCDHRLALLFLYLRTLFDALEIRNSKYGLLSSYHILLLAVHFLQSEQALTPWPVMPILCKTHSSLVGAHIPIDDVVSLLDLPRVSIEWKSNNHMSTAELAIRFVDYYSNFDTSQHVIYIEKGLAARRRQVSGEVRLLLVDPYSSMTVCRSSAAAKAFADAMVFLRRKMANGLFLDSFPSFPEATMFHTHTKYHSWRLYVQERKVVVDKRTQEQSQDLELQEVDAS